MWTKRRLPDCKAEAVQSVCLRRVYVCVSCGVQRAGRVSAGTGTRGAQWLSLGGLNQKLEPQKGSPHLAKALPPISEATRYTVTTYSFNFPPFLAHYIHPTYSALFLHSGPNSSLNTHCLCLIYIHYNCTEDFSNPSISFLLLSSPSLALRGKV